MTFKVTGSARRTGGVGDPEITDLLRRVTNVLRYGRVHSADYPAARLRVIVGQEDDGTNHIVTDWIPWLTLRAAADREWWAPEVGEAVLLLSPGGELTTAVALPAIFSDAHPVPADRETVHRTVYADGAVVEYDRAAHRLRAAIPGDIEATAAGRVTAEAGGDMAATAGGAVSVDAGTTVAITAAESVTVTAPSVAIVTSGGVAALSGNFQMTGNLTVTGSISATGDILAGGANSNHHSH